MSVESTSQERLNACRYSARHLGVLAIVDAEESVSANTIASCLSLKFMIDIRQIVALYCTQVVKVWDMSTGKKTFEFSVGSCGISSIGIDKSGKRYSIINVL